MYELLIITNIKEYNHYLNDNDTIKINKFVNVEDRLRSIGSIILQKNYINSKYNQDLKEIVIQYTELGKPFYKDLIYNVSHDSELVIIVYSVIGCIGVDIMKYKDINIYKFHNCFTNREKQELTCINFLSYWCAKEAFLKATGQGLTVDISSIEYINGFINYDNCLYKVIYIDIAGYVCAIVQLPTNYFHA